MGTRLESKNSRRFHMRIFTLGALNINCCQMKPAHYIFSDCKSSRCYQLQGVKTQFFVFYAIRRKRCFRDGASSLVWVLHMHLTSSITSAQVPDYLQEKILFFSRLSISLIIIPTLLYRNFIEAEKVFDNVDRNVIWQLMHLY